MTSLFISYSRKDIEAARKLTEAFKTEGLDFWIDWEGIPPTVDWWREIEKGIEEADIFLFLLSPDSAESKVCQQEIEHAVKNGKRLIPIVVREINSEKAPSELSHLNWIFIREHDNFETVFDKLIAAIKTDYVWAQAHRQLQVKALEWQRSGYENSFLLHGKELQEAELNLALNTPKEPHPTDLQREYVLKSRQTTDRQRRNLTSATFAALLIMAALAVFGFTQARLANANAELANANAEKAADQAATAEANRAEARRQADIALARQLAAQAIVQSESNPGLGMLLAQEAVNRQSRLQLPESAESINNLLTPLLAGPRPLRYLYGHQGPVLQVAVSPDSQWMASAGADATIKIWNAGNGQLLFNLHEHAGPVNSLAFLPDESKITLASGGEDGIVRLWEWDDPKEPPEHQELIQFDAPIGILTFSPYDSLIAVGTDDGLIHVHDLAAHRNRFVFAEHTGTIRGLAFDANGLILASSDSNNDVRLWDLDSGEAINPPQPISDPYGAEYVQSITFSPYNNLVAAHYGFNAVRLNMGDVASIASATPLIQHTSAVRSVAFNSDGTRFASASEDWRVGYCYDPGPDCSLVIYLKGHRGPVNSVVFSADDRWLVSGGDDGYIIVWNALFPYISHSLASPRDSYYGQRWNVEGLAFGPDNRTLASSNWDNSIRLWDVESQSIIDEFYPNQGTLGIIAFHPDGTKLAFAAGYGPHSIWNTNGTVHKTLPIEGSLGGAAFSPDGKWLVTDNNSGNSICLWEVAGDGSRCAALPEGETTSRMAFSSDGRLLATNSSSNLLLWDLTTDPIRPRKVGAHEGNIFSLAFSPDDLWLASGGGDYTIRLWPVAGDQNQTEKVINNSGRFARSVAFSPDGLMLVSANEDWTVRWWDANTGQPLTPPVQIRALWRMDSLAFSPDGKWLATGSFDGIIDLWPGNVEEWKKVACQVTNRNLTQTEYARFIGVDPSAYPEGYLQNLTCPDAPSEATATK